VELHTAIEPVPQTDVKPRNFFSLLCGVYGSPKATFTEIGRSPRVLVPMIALIVLGLIAGYCMMLRIDIVATIADQVDKAIAAGRLTREQAEQQMALYTKIGNIQIIIGSAIGSVLSALIFAAIFKMITFFVGAENRFKAVFSATLYALFAVSVVQSALLILILFIKSPGEVDISSVRSVLASNLGAMLESILGDDTLPKFLAKFFAWIDVFAVWIIALLSIGYAAVSKKMKTSTAATWIVGIYLVIAIIAAAWSSRG
jgi:hypothetical protein